MAESLATIPLAKLPVILLKTKSSPADLYEELFSKERNGYVFEPTFLPVLHHSFQESGMTAIKQLLEQHAINNSANARYGGLIFTSQRAVEAFSKIVDEKHGTEGGWLHLQDVPIYSVGPATTRALQALSREPPLQIFGEHTGNGDALARFILDHYGRWYHDRPVKPPILFLVGEQRRDIIPKTLMSMNLPNDRRIQVEEVVVYGTGVMKSFAQDFGSLLKATETRPSRWIVVFSPTGCDSMLRGLGLLDEGTGKVIEKNLGNRKTFVATIGPTTRDHLRRTFNFEPDVCADEPSPEGIKKGIVKFLQSQG